MVPARLAPLDPQRRVSSLAAGLLFAAASSGCLFDLGDVQAIPPGEVPRDSSDDGAAEVEAGSDAGAEAETSASPDVEAGPLDGCWPVSDAELCELAALRCGPLETIDDCGQARVIAACGDCGALAHCETGVCVDYAFDWESSPWTSCTAPCGGGSQTRDVWCKRDDGTTVADAFCTGSKPAASQGCNQDPCCSPSCVAHDACGSDGCGGDCGTCGSDRTCHDGYCVWDHGNDGSVTCATLCSWGSSACVDTSTADCSTKAVMTCYCW